MGAVNVIHGVSGGTIALITGIHHSLLHAIVSIDREAIWLMLNLQFRKSWKKIHGPFLLTWGAGVLTGVLIISRFIFYLVDNYPIFIHSFFFGVILISAPLLLRRIHHFKWSVLWFFLLGTGITCTLSFFSPIPTPNNTVFSLVTGILISCSLIFPGISGFSIVLHTGKYQYLMNSIQEPNIPVIIAFIVGWSIGLVGFARLLHSLFSKYYNIMIALLAGAMLGALYRLWPWQNVREYITTLKGRQIPLPDRPILPWDYVEKTGKDPQVFQAILMMAFGIFVVVLIEKIVARLKT